MATEGEDRLNALASIGRGTSWMVVGSVLFLIFGFFGRLGVARYVSVTAWGVFNLGISLSGFLTILALLGLHQATARTLAFEKDPWVRRAVVRRSLLITSLDATGVSLAVYLFAPDLAHVFSPGSLGPMTEVLQLFSVLIGITLMSSYFAALFQGFERAQPNAWFNQALNPGLFVLFLVAVVDLHLGFTSVLVAYVLAGGIALVALGLYTVRRLPPVFHRPAQAPPAGGALIPGAFWNLTIGLWGVNSLAFVTTFVDTMILGVFWPASTVGIYSAATTFARLFLVANGALTYIFLPVTARLARANQFGAIRSTFLTSARWTTATGIPLLFVFLFLPGQSLRVFFGHSYDPGALSLQILTLGAFLSVLAGPLSACLAGLGKSRSMLITASVSATTNVALSFLLIPTFGATGAAVAWSLSRFAFVAVGGTALVLAAGVTSLRRPLLIPLGLTLAAGGPLFLAAALVGVPGWTIFPLAIAALGIYVGSVLLTRSLSSGDLLAVGAVERVLRRPLPRLRRFLERFVGDEPSVPPTRTPV